MIENRLECVSCGCSVFSSLLHLMTVPKNMSIPLTQCGDVLSQESKQRFDADEEFRKRAYDCVVRLQTYEPTCFKTWQMICEISTAG